MNRTSNDGSHFYQEIFREYSLPETLKLEKMTSNLTKNGVLTMLNKLSERAIFDNKHVHKVLRVEAPYTGTPKIQSIPIENA